jgi:hypothetical protein
MLDVIQSSFELPDTPAKIIATGLLNQSKARNDFWIYRQLIDGGFVKSWWQENAAWYLQQFYADTRRASGRSWCCRPRRSTASRAW